MSETAKNQQGQKPKISKLAILSLISGVVSLVGLLSLLVVGILSPFFSSLPDSNWFNPRIILPGAFFISVSGIISAVVALNKIRKSEGLLSGTKILQSGQVMSIGALIIVCMDLWLIFTGIGPHNNASKETVCRINLSHLGKAMLIYANDYDARYPTADKWCDLLITYCEVRPKQLVCKGSGTRIGESSYAMNKNLVGRKVTEIPEDVVILFETSFGKNPAGRKELLGNREWYKELSSRGDRLDLEWVKKYRPSEKVYKQRWNQVGGPEILTTENHKGRGCNILFITGRVEFVEPERLGQLKWKVGEDANRGAEKKP
jgi:hypothetical protein